MFFSCGGNNQISIETNKSCVVSGVTTQKATTFPILTTVPTTATTLKKTTIPNETGSPNPTTNPASTPTVCEPEGVINTRDVLEGSCIKIKCPGACLKIVSVLFGCKMSEGFSDEQRLLIEQLCDVNDVCVIRATNEFFGTNLECEKGTLWLKFQ